MAESSTIRRPIIIGSRKSDLAMWQAREVVRLLQLHEQAALAQKNSTTSSTPSPPITPPPISSSSSSVFEIQTEISLGDKISDKSLASLATSNPGLFTKELEVGLIAKVYDIAVHSLKDMPTSLPEGLMLAGIGEREDPRDAFILSARHGAGGKGKGSSGATTPTTTTIRSLSDLPAGSIVGTSSVRREALMKRDYPHLIITGVRGNLNTRMKKLDDDNIPSAAAPSITSDAAAATTTSAASLSAPTSTTTPSSPPPPTSYDALLLATAGIVRMGWKDRITARLSPSSFPYGVGQGALGIECRVGDEMAMRLARSVSHGPSAIRCLTERAFLNRLQGGCQVPIGVHTYFDGQVQLEEMLHDDDEGEDEEEASSFNSTGEGSSGSSRSNAEKDTTEVLPATTNYKYSAAAATTTTTTTTTTTSATTTTTTTTTRKHNPLPSTPPCDTDGTPAVPERVRTITLEGTIMSLDGQTCISASISEPVVVPEEADQTTRAIDHKPPTSLDEGYRSSTCRIITNAQWERMVADGTRIGRALAERLLRSGGQDILGPITAPVRDITYGAAEQPLDR